MAVQRIFFGMVKAEQGKVYERAQLVRFPKIRARLD